MNKTIKHELQHILRGESQVSHGTLIQTIACYLRTSSPTSSMAQTDEQFRAKETAALIDYIIYQQLWIQSIDFTSFVSEGAEQRVYIKNENHVYKLNDAIYYASWLDYLHNLLLNNYFFPDTAYTLIGFYSDDNSLYALVDQPYVRANKQTDLTKVKEFMAANGFENTRNHDYYNPDLGIILEDLHDENVLTKNDMQYFIDTVFYIKPEIFWS
jgi:Serine/Threonine/Tyrosine Kinase found in polyvalent proteins